MPRKKVRYRTIGDVMRDIATKKYEIDLLEIELEELQGKEENEGGASAIGFFIDPDPED